MNQISQRFIKFNSLDNINKFIFLLSNEDASVCRISAKYISDMNDPFYVLYLNLVNLYFIFYFIFIEILKLFCLVVML